MKRSQVGRIKKLASDDDDGGNKFMRTVMADYWHISMEIRQWLCGTTHTRSKSVRPEDTDEMKWENECGRQWDGVSQSERERERDISNEIEWCSVCKWWKIPSPGSLCVCECVCVSGCVCGCGCVRERERGRKMLNSIDYRNNVRSIFAVRRQSPPKTSHRATLVYQIHIRTFGWTNCLELRCNIICIIWIISGLHRNRSSSESLFLLCRHYFRPKVHTIIPNVR